MGIFGWSYPPGAASDPFAPYNQDDGQCEVCGKECGSCICPECPQCLAQGDPRCYTDHGLTRSDDQVASLAEVDRAQKEALDAEAEYWRTHSPDIESDS